MKSIQTIVFVALAMLCVSCGKSKKQEVEKSKETYGEKTDEKTGISSLNKYERTDSVTVNGVRYDYTFAFHPVDSLPHVKYPATCAEYLDNATDLTIKRGSEVICKKSFTKSSFKSYIPEKLYKSGGFIGFTYNEVRKMENKNDAFYFIATIGNLDDQEEIAFSLEIKIDTAGGMVITKFEDSETEPMSNGLTVDPDADGV